MKTEREIQDAFNNMPPSDTTIYPNMNYEHGVEEALLWILGEIPDEEFPFSKKEK